MSLESGSRRAVDNQWVRENETNEYRINYIEDEYTKAVRILAQSRRVPWFEELLSSYIRCLEGKGYTINPDEFVYDIDKKVRFNDLFDAANELNSSLNPSLGKTFETSDVQQSNNISSVDEPKSYDDIIAEAQQLSEETKREIASLKENLSGIFGDSTEEISGFHR